MTAITERWSNITRNKPNAKGKGLPLPGPHNGLHVAFPPQSDKDASISMLDPRLNVGNQLFFQLHGWINNVWNDFRDAKRFFADLERAASARFYRNVGGLGRLFMEIEAQGFAMLA